MWNTDKIIEKVKDSADRYGLNNPQQSKQLAFAIGKSDGQEIANALFSFFTIEQINTSDRQELAGSLLYKLKPQAEFDLKSIILKSLKYYDPSVEELPYYMVEAKGLDFTVSEINKIETSFLSSIEKRSLDTVKYWLRNYEQFKPA